MLLAGATHALAALLIVAALSLIGFATLPASIRRRSILAFPAALATGSLTVGWSAWIIGTFIGTRAVFVWVALLALAALAVVRPWAIASVRWFRLCALLARANLLGSIALAAMLLLAVPPLLLPLVDSDGIAYHVALPKLFLLTGHVWFVPWTFVSSFPQAMEMIFMIGLRVAGGETAKFIHALFFVMSLLTLSITVWQNRSTRAAAYIAPILYAAPPLVLAPAGAAFVDHATMFFVAASALVLFRRGSPLIAGCALGAAMATKITAAPAIAGLLIYSIVKRQFRESVALALPIVIAFLPFAIRNVRHTGDPIYPVGYVLLHRNVPGIAAERIAYGAYYHGKSAGPLGIDWTPRPGGDADEVAGIHHVVGLFALALAIPFPRTRRWLALIVPYLLIAMVFKPPTRYLLPMFYGLAVLEAYAATLLFRRWATAAAILVSMPALVVSAAFMLQWMSPSDYLMGREDRTRFLATRIPGYRAAVFVNAQHSDGLVMALDFPAPYYFDRPWIAEGILNQPPLQAWIHTAQTSDDVLARLRVMRVRYLVITPGYGGGTRGALMPLASSPHDAQLIAAFRRRLKLLQTIDGVDVVEVPAQ